MKRIADDRIYYLADEYRNRTSPLGGAMKTYYEILGVSKRATKEEIEKAYQKITNAGYVVFTDGLTPQILYDAYTTLTDPYKRGRYDESLIHGEGNYDVPLVRYDREAFKPKKKGSITFPGILFAVMIAVFVFFGIVLGPGLLSWLGSRNTYLTTTAPSQNGSKNVTVMEDQTQAEPMPATGTVYLGNEYITSGDIDKDHARLTIDTTKSDTNFLIKLKDPLTHANLIEFFVRKGDTSSFNVRLGQYEMYYASVENWYGNTDLFGKNTRYRKADTLLELYRTDKQVIGRIIKLYGQVDGNMTETEVGEAEF
jgi:curved DNA-binding protein CbpA